MPDYQIIPISFEFAIEVHPRQPVSVLNETKEVIEKTWQKEMDKKGSYLFNGSILSMRELKEDRMIGEFIDYKLHLAQLRHPKLREELHVQPVCVSGITLSGDRVLIGQRAAGVAHAPSMYELIPSGGIDPSSVVNQRIDIKKQFFAELEEEAHISTNAIAKCLPFAIAYDEKTGVYEICAEIILKENYIPQIVSNVEYQKMWWIPEQDLSNFVLSHEKDFVPLSLYLLGARFDI